MFLDWMQGFWEVCFLQSGTQAALPSLLAARPAQTSFSSPSDMLSFCTNLWQRWSLPEAACLDGVGPAGICIPSFRS